MSSAIRTILVHIDAAAASAVRLRCARQLAAEHGSAVTALYAVRPAYAPLALEIASLGVAGAALLAADAAREAAAHRRVAEVCQEPGVAVDFQVAPEGQEVAFVRHALYADLVVLGAHDAAARDTAVPPDFVPMVLIESGKPALVVPHAQVPASRFDTIVVGWKAAREAARAVAAALPLLQAAKVVHVVMERSDAAGDESRLLQRHLERHGVQARQHQLDADTAAAGDALLARAAQLGADLLVMGCYGHSRARERVLGGATRTVLQRMALPVLMAH